MGRRELDWCGSGYEQMAGSCECGDEHSGSKNAGIFLLAEDLLASQEGLYLMELLVICFPREVSRCAVGKETVGRCVYTSVFFFRNLASYPRQI